MKFSNTLGIVLNFKDFVITRLPNFKEVGINAVYKAGMDTFLGRFSLIFGDNPTASAVYRDALKINVAYALKGTEIGKTGIFHDEGGIYASTAKVICKISLLSTYASSSILQDNLVQYMKVNNNINPSFDKDSAFQLVARSGNYICETPARLLNIASRERQLQIKNDTVDKSTGFSSFIKDKFDYSWIMESVGSGLSKTMTSDQVGELIKQAGYANYIRETVSIIDNSVACFLGGKISSNPIQSKDDIYTKIYKTSAMFDFDIQNPNLYYSCASIISVNFAGNVAKEIINSEVFLSTTKSVQDFTGALSKDLHAAAEEVFSYFYSDSPATSVWEGI